MTFPEEVCHDHRPSQLAVGDRWCSCVLILHFCFCISRHRFLRARVFSLRTTLLCCAVILSSRLAVHAPSSRIQFYIFFIHTYSVTDKNNIQDLFLEFSCVISRPLHRVSRDRGFFIYILYHVKQIKNYYLVPLSIISMSLNMPTGCNI
jgi:hypothetical protein